VGNDITIEILEKRMQYVNKGHFCNNVLNDHSYNNAMKGKTARILGKGQSGKDIKVKLPL
jgi:hypothetical protein